MFILSENTLLHGVRGFGCRCSCAHVPTRSVRFLRTFDHYTGPVLSWSHLSISECSKPMGLKSKCSLAQFSCILEANGSSTQILLNIRLKQKRHRHKRCKPWISGYLIILALNIWSTTPFSSSIYVSIPPKYFPPSQLFFNQHLFRCRFWDGLIQHRDKSHHLVSCQLPATTLSLPGRSPPESLKGVPPWMQSLGKDTGDLVPLVHL